MSAKTNLNFVFPGAVDRALVLRTLSAAMQPSWGQLQTYMFLDFDTGHMETGAYEPDIVDRFIEGWDLLTLYPQNNEWGCIREIKGAKSVVVSAAMSTLRWEKDEVLSTSAKLWNRLEQLGLIVAACGEELETDGDLYTQDGLTPTAILALSESVDLCEWTVVRGPSSSRRALPVAIDFGYLYRKERLS